MNKTTTEMPREGYGPVNLPPSKDEASGRLMTCKHTYEEIETQLELYTPDMYPDGNTYINWRRRATRAATHLKREMKFLQRWLQEQDNTAQQPEDLQNPKLEEAQKRLALSVEELRGDYKIQYTQHSPPATLRQAQERKAEISPLLGSFNFAFKDAKAFAAWGGLTTKKEIEQFCEPLAELYREIQQEAALVNRALRTLGEHRRRTDDDWVMFLLSIVERAVAGGLVLSEKERTVVEKIRDKRLSELA